MKLFSSLAFILLFSISIVQAHEEPTKTLKEKQEKVKRKTAIFIGKVKTSTTWKYEVTEGKISDKKSKIIHQEYDKTGNLTGISAYRNDSLIERAEYTYNSYHDMLTDTDFSPEGIILEKNVFTYDKQGRVLSGESFNGRDILTGRFVNKFNRANNTIEFVKYGKKDSLEYTITYKYKNDFDKFDYYEAIKKNPKGDEILKVEKIINPDKLVTKKIITGADEAGTYSFEFKYNAKKDIQEIIKKNNKGNIEWQEEYLYQQNGNLYEVLKKDAKGNIISDIKYTYEFYK